MEVLGLGFHLRHNESSGFSAAIDRETTSSHEQLKPGMVFGDIRLEALRSRLSGLRFQV